MLIQYIKKDFALSRRNVFVLLIFLFPIIIAFGASGILDTYSNVPKIVLLENEKGHYPLPSNLEVYYAEDKEEFKHLVYDIDTKIGIENNALVLDGRESDFHVEQAEMMLAGKLSNINNLNEIIFQKVFAFNLYGSLIFSGIMILFSLVEERSNSTTELLKTHPVHPAIPILSKVIVVGLITTMDFIICNLILKTPFQPIALLTVLFIGIVLGAILGLTLAFYASNETQALAILKPVSMVYLMAIPALGFFVGGVMHTIALVTNPFYWLLQLVHGLFEQQLDSKLIILSIITSIILIIIISKNWHRTPYGVKKFRT